MMKIESQGLVAMLSDGPAMSCKRSESAYLRPEKPEVTTRHVLATLTSTTICPAIQRKQCGYAFSAAALAVTGPAGQTLKSCPAYKRQRCLKTSSGFGNAGSGSGSRDWPGGKYNSKIALPYRRQFGN
jgi:hypothetical protein